MNRVPKDLHIVRNLNHPEVLCPGSRNGADMEITDAFIEKLTAYAGSGGS